VIDAAVAALRAGRPVVLPTDTVYGLCAEPTEAAAAEVARLKGREVAQPTALLAASVEALMEAVPELPEQLVRALLPGAYTLILPNPSRRFSWLSRDNADAIGVRVPNLRAETAAILAAAGPVLATSANVHGGPDPRRLEDVPAAIREACAAAVDGGELPGTPSTVLDLTGAEPRVVREGAVPAADALAATAKASSI
jgi:L-threonylcarbamoyladenylate synthase